MFENILVVFFKRTKTVLDNYNISIFTLSVKCTQYIYLISNFNKITQLKKVTNPLMSAPKTKFKAHLIVSID